MTFDELFEKEKNCKKINVFRILTIPVLVISLILVELIMVGVGGEGYETSVLLINFIGAIKIGRAHV